MCVCVFWSSLCSKFFFFKLRDYHVDWIIGWVVCWIAFMSVFFSSRKTVLKSWLDTSSIPCYLSSFLSLFLIAILIAPRNLVDRLSFCSWIWFLISRYLLDTSAVDKHLLDSFLDTSRHLICLDLRRVLYKPPHAIRTSFHSISLLIALCFLSQTFSSHSLFLKDFSSFFKNFFTW